MDAIYAAFLHTQYAEGMALAADSDLLTLVPVSGRDGQAFGFVGDPACDGLLVDRYLAHFTCRGLRRDAAGAVVEATDWTIGIWFPEGYCRHVRSQEVLTCLTRGAWHPNCASDGPFLCIGDIAPTTALTELLYRCFEVLTYQNVTMDERNALNHAACVWARRHRDRFPIDPRPLRRRPSAAPVVPFAVVPE